MEPTTNQDEKSHFSDNVFPFEIASDKQIYSLDTSALCKGDPLSMLLTNSDESTCSIYNADTSIGNDSAYLQEYQNSTYPQECQKQEYQNLKEESSGFSDAAIADVSVTSHEFDWSCISIPEAVWRPVPLNNDSASTSSSPSSSLQHQESLDVIDLTAEDDNEQINISPTNQDDFHRFHSETNLNQFETQQDYDLQQSSAAELTNVNHQNTSFLSSLMDQPTFNYTDHHQTHIKYDHNNNLGYSNLSTSFELENVNSIPTQQPTIESDDFQSSSDVNYSQISNEQGSIYHPYTAQPNLIHQHNYNDFQNNLNGPYNTSPNNFPSYQKPPACTSALASVYMQGSYNGDANFVPIDGITTTPIDGISSVSSNQNSPLLPINLDHGSAFNGSMQSSNNDCNDLVRHQSNQSRTPDIKLSNRDLWWKFYEIGTEMIITKAGRRLFPAIKLDVSGLKPNSIYAMCVDVVPVDNSRYRYVYHSSQWMAAGTTETATTPRTYIHPDSPARGEIWMRQAVTFDKLKLTNNETNTKGHVILNSMHKYQPRIHIVELKPGEKINHLIPFNRRIDELERNDVTTFVFPECAFTTVTAYQNQQITKLKIDRNPFAKGFRDTNNKHHWKTKCGKKWNLDSGYLPQKDAIKNGVNDLVKIDQSESSAKRHKFDDLISFSDSSSINEMSTTESSSNHDDLMACNFMDNIDSENNNYQTQTLENKTPHYFNEFIPKENNLFTNIFHEDNSISSNGSL